MTTRKQQQTRKRADTVSGAIDTLRAANRSLTPPAHVTMHEADWPFWQSVVAEFARSEWTNHQLEVAAFLARTMADLEREQMALREEGAVLKSDKGTPVVNPRKAVVQMHAGTILSLRRSLSLHARAQGGEARDIAKRRTQAKKVEADAGGPDDRSALLASPPELLQ